MIMKALAGVLLAFALAAGVGNQADAHNRCLSGKRTTKHVTKHSSAVASRSSKSKLTNCVCHVGTSKTKHIGSAGIMRSSSYGGYKKAANSTMLNTMESTDTMFNGNRSLNNDNRNMDMNNGNRNFSDSTRNMDLNNFNNGLPRTDSMINPNGTFDNRNLDNRSIDSLNNGSTGEFMDHGK